MAFSDLPHTSPPPVSAARARDVLLDELERSASRSWEIREILQLAGVPTGNVPLEGPTRPAWMGALGAAALAGRTAELAGRLRERYPENKPLIDALAVWTALLQGVQVALFAEGTGRGPCLPDFLSPNTYGDPPYNNPGALLNARYQVVPFFEDPVAGTLADLRRWRDSDDPTSVRLFVGPGGSGKTRLFIHWCQQIASDGWLAGFLPADLSDEQIGCLARTAQRTIVVVDYAEARPELLRLLRAVAARPTCGVAPLRVVLLARAVADWWRSLLALDDDVRDLLERHDPVELTSLPLEGPLRAQAYSQAMAAFATQRSKPIIATQPNLSDPLFQRMLYVHMAALAAVEGLPARPAALLRTIVEHEQRFWQARYRSAQGDVLDAAELDRARARFVAAVTLRGGAPTREAAEALNQTVGAPGEKNLVPFMRTLYARPGLYLAGLEPDLLGEHLVATVLRDPNTPSAFLTQLFMDAGAAELRSGFLVLGRIALEGERDAEEWLRRVLEADVVHRARPALDAALSLGERSAHAPLGALLAAALTEHGTRETAQEFAGLIPYPTVSLREVGLWTVQHQVSDAGGRQGETRRASLLDRLRGQFGIGSIETQAKRAGLLMELGVRLNDLGRSEAALRAAEEAVAILRKLAAAPGGAGLGSILPGLAKGLSNLSMMLSKLGRREEALRAAQEAVAIRRALTHPARARAGAEDSGSYLPDLALSLNNLGTMLSALGRRNEALAAAEETTCLYRKLACAHPDGRGAGSYLPDLAVSLNNLGKMLSDFGRREDALAAAEEAVAILRKMAQTGADAFLPALATSLSNLSDDLSDLGRHREALRATEEAIGIYRPLAQARPDAFLPDLAVNLTCLYERLSALERGDDALRAAEEAAAICRNMAQDRPDIFLSELASSLMVLSIALSNQGRREDALRASEEAAAIYQGLAQARPDAFLPGLATSLNNLGGRLSELDWLDEARIAYHHAVGALSRPFLARPAAFARQMEMLLDDYLTLAEQLHQPPDVTLLSPIFARFKELSADRGEGETGQHAR